MTLIDPPPVVPFGFVTGRFALAVADTSRDEDHMPDFEPAKGEILFRPAAAKIVAQSPSRYISPLTVTCTLNPLGQVADANGLGGIWLVAGTYSVTFKLTGISVPAFDIVVTAEHTIAAPLDLVQYAPTPIEPSVKFVVNEQVYTETLAARDETLAARDEAVAAAAGGGTGAGIDDAATATTTTWSSSKIDTSLAEKAAATHTHVTSQVTGLDAALASKAATGHTHTASQVSDASTVGRNVLTAADAPAARAAIGAGTSSLVVGTTAGTAADAAATTTALAGKANTSHTHTTAQVTGLDTALAGKAATSHTHAQADVTGLDTALAGMVASDDVQRIHYRADGSLTGLIDGHLYLTPKV